MADPIARPPWDFFHDASLASLQSFELSRLNHAANLRRQVSALLDQWIDENSQALLARWVREHRSLPPERASASPHEFFLASNQPATVNQSPLRNQPLLAAEAAQAQLAPSVERSIQPPKASTRANPSARPAHRNSVLANSAHPNSALARPVRTPHPQPRPATTATSNPPRKFPRPT